MAQNVENVVSMEKELLVRQVMKRGGGHVSGGDQQPVEIATTEQTSKVNITIHEEATKTSSREERLKKLMGAIEESQKTQAQKPKIQRVPIMLRDLNNCDKYYEPRVAAIGPFHHGKPKYEPAEKVKLLLAANFIKDSEQSQEALLKTVEESIKELRECYDEEATKDYDDEYLAWMLFVDGCSMLEFIYKYEHLEDIRIKRDQVAFAKQDILLLENQLPFQLLRLLMSSSNKHKELEDSIESFLQMHGVGPDNNQRRPDQTPKGNTGDIEKAKGVPKDKEQEHEHAHLLDLLRTRMLGRNGDDDRVTKKCQSLLDLLPTRMLGCNRDDDHVTKKRQSFRNVQELRAAGILFKPSRSKSLRDIQYKSHLGRGFLSLPRLEVDDSTGPKFMNLIAYEMCPDFHNDFGVTSYIGFLDSLIDHPDDVKYLRKKRILHNLLGSDDEVTLLFNAIGTDLVPNSDIYRRVINQIEEHYDAKWRTWVAQVYHDHFSSPWTMLAFIGVLFGLWMSSIQTWYTVFSEPSPCDAVCEYLKTRPR